MKSIINWKLCETTTTKTYHNVRSADNSVCRRCASCTGPIVPFRYPATENSLPTDRLFDKKLYLDVDIVIRLAYFVPVPF